MTVSRVNLPPVLAIDGTSLKDDQLHAKQPVSQKQGTSGRLHAPKGARGNLLANIKRAEKASGARSKEESTANAGFTVACELIEAFGTDKLASGLLRHLGEMIGPQATPTQIPTATDLIAIAINWLRTGGSPGQENDSVGAHDTSAPKVERGPASEVGKSEGR